MQNEVTTHIINDFVLNYNVYITNINHRSVEWLKADLF